MTLRVGRIPYLNCEPFFAYLEGVETLTVSPRALGEAMAAGRLDAGPVPLADFIALTDAIRRLRFGIATPGAAHSVLVFSRSPLATLHGATIGVTEETSTSVRILQLLLKLRYGIRGVSWAKISDDVDAILLIGDQALQARAQGTRFEQCIDLGAEWKAWTGLPCVFAVWAIVRTVPEEAGIELERALDVALLRGVASLQEIAARRRETGLDEGQTISYLKNFIYRFGPREEAAIEEFTRLLPLVK
ncbi:MAG: menaquinone biosynthetic enzyme MqnA/MqnD family protein [Candidatus Methylomirabilia bacterium]